MAINDKKELTKAEEKSKQFQKGRRDFLGKSKYAVYMTPLMLSMIVDKDAHANTNPCPPTSQNPACQ